MPFEATKKELRSIFGNYGTVKSVRIPTKYTGGHRGFAFIDFATHEDAVTALSSLNATHMYGRRLNLEWAKEETTVTGIRKKIKVQDK